MRCKLCLMELPQGQMVCPTCGLDNSSYQHENIPQNTTNAQQNTNLSSNQNTNIANQNLQETTTVHTVPPISNIKIEQNTMREPQPLNQPIDQSVTTNINLASTGSYENPSQEIINQTIQKSETPTNFTNPIISQNNTPSVPKNNEPISQIIQPQNSEIQTVSQMPNNQAVTKESVQISNNMNNMKKQSMIFHYIFMFLTGFSILISLLTAFLSHFNTSSMVPVAYSGVMLLGLILKANYGRILAMIQGVMTTIIGIIIAIILWWNNFIYRVIDPYLTIINSLPKVAMGPIIIIYFGANINSIIIMALLISVIVTIITVYNGFISTDQNRINLLKSFSASKYQIFKMVILPSSYPTIISSLKINVSMSLIGVIMGEFLVSKEGIGYLIMYGSQVFNLNLVISGIIILMIVSYLMYLIVSYIEKRLIKKD